MLLAHSTSVIQIYWWRTGYDGTRRMETTKFYVKHSGNFEIPRQKFTIKIIIGGLWGSEEYDKSFFFFFVKRRIAVERKRDRSRTAEFQKIINGVKLKSLTCFSQPGEEKEQTLIKISVRIIYFYFHPLWHYRFSIFRLLLVLGHQFPKELLSSGTHQFQLNVALTWWKVTANRE